MFEQAIGAEARVGGRDNGEDPLLMLHVYRENPGCTNLGCVSDSCGLIVKSEKNSW